MLFVCVLCVVFFFVIITRRGGVRRGNSLLYDISLLPLESINSPRNRKAGGREIETSFGGLVCGHTVDSLARALPETLQ